MKKLSGILALLVMLSLAGCGDGEKPAAKPPLDTYVEMIDVELLDADTDNSELEYYHPEQGLKLQGLNLDYPSLVATLSGFAASYDSLYPIDESIMEKNAVQTEGEVYGIFSLHLSTNIYMYISYEFETGLVFSIAVVAYTDKPLLDEDILTFDAYATCITLILEQDIEESAIIFQSMISSNVADFKDRFGEESSSFAIWRGKTYIFTSTEDTAMFNVYPHSSGLSTP